MKTICTAHVTMEQVPGARSNAHDVALITQYLAAVAENNSARSHGVLPKMPRSRTKTEPIVGATLSRLSLHHSDFSEAISMENRYFTSDFTSLS